MKMAYQNGTNQKFQKFTYKPQLAYYVYVHSRNVLYIRGYDVSYNQFKPLQLHNFEKKKTNWSKHHKILYQALSIKLTKIKCFANIGIMFWSQVPFKLNERMKYCYLYKAIGFGKLLLDVLLKLFRVIGNSADNFLQFGK